MTWNSRIAHIGHLPRVAALLLGRGDLSCVGLEPLVLTSGMETTYFVLNSALHGSSHGEGVFRGRQSKLVFFSSVLRKGERLVALQRVDSYI